MQATIVVPLRASGMLCFDLNRDGTVKVTLEREVVTDGGGAARDVAEAAVNAAELRRIAAAATRLAEQAERRAARIRPEGCAVERGRPPCFCAERRACPCAHELAGAC